MTSTQARFDRTRPLSLWRGTLVCWLFALLSLPWLFIPFLWWTSVSNAAIDSPTAQTRAAAAQADATLQPLLCSTVGAWVVLMAFAVWCLRNADNDMDRSTVRKAIRFGWVAVPAWLAVCVVLGLLNVLS